MWHGGYIEFTPALERLKEEEGLLGLVVDGQRYDIGTPDSYVQTIQALLPWEADRRCPRGCRSAAFCMVVQ